MGVNIFVFFLFVGSVLFMFSDIETIQDEIETQEKPMVSFYNSTTYSLDQNNVSSIVKSDEAYLYKKREEMVNLTLLSRDKQSSNADFLKADFAIKLGNDFYFDGNVFFEATDGLNLTSEQLEYNSINKIVKNNIPFEMEHNGNLYFGEKLYYDSKNSYIKASKINFLIKETNNND
jgi:hypothetical protein